MVSAVAIEAPQGAQRWMLVVQVQGEELEEARRETGAEMQVGQRRRWREGRCEGGGVLYVQFYIHVDGQLWAGAMERRIRRDGGRKQERTYATDNPSTPPTIADQIPRTR